MLKKLFQKSARCKICRNSLTPENLHTGFCDKCGVKEMEKLRKRMLVSSIVGVILVGAVAAAFLYARATYFILDQYGYKGDIFIPTSFGHFTFNARIFSKIMNLSVPARILTAAFCFCVPFSSFVKIEFKTYRDQAERNLYKADAIAGNMAASCNQQRTDEVGIFIMSAMISAVSGPYFFLYRLYKLCQLSKYNRKQGITLRR